jgi:hypothetical protein
MDSFIPNNRTSSTKMSDISGVKYSSSGLTNSNYNSNSNSLMSSQSSIVQNILQIKWWVWVIIFLILAYMGFNVFTYLGNLINILIDIWNSLTIWINKHFGTNFSELAKQTINVSATGAKGAVDIVQGVANTTIDTVSSSDDYQENAPAKEVKEPPPSEIDNIVQNGGVPNNAENQIEAAPAYSSVGQVENSGWCYIGEDQDVRTCAKVGQNNMCMSGDIFPTHDICVNPNLRT